MTKSDLKCNEYKSGHGLGLYKAKELAQQLGGDLFVESLVGHGSCTTLRLPQI
ncbi:ATP-binding protein [Streptococcus mitis]|nr:ATP-binding protein [Streptococcus sp. NLN76]MBF8971008.1 ATP-binding protein [Streptococcus sp. NLN76]